MYTIYNNKCIQFLFSPVRLYLKSHIKYKLFFLSLNQIFKRRQPWLLPQIIFVHYVAVGFGFPLVYFSCFHAKKRSSIASLWAFNWKLSFTTVSGSESYSNILRKDSLSYNRVLHTYAVKYFSDFTAIFFREILRN